MPTDGEELCRCPINTQTTLGVAGNVAPRTGQCIIPRNDASSMRWRRIQQDVPYLVILTSFMQLIHVPRLWSISADLVKVESRT